MRKTGLVTAFVALAITVAARAESIPTKVVHEDLPASKQTIAKLYLTAEEAYDVWKNQRDIKMIDVRTVAEYAFVGHPTMAVSVPVKFATRRWDPAAGRYSLADNEAFLEEVAKLVKPDELVLVTCRSGQRSAVAADLMTEAGYKNAYSVVDGFEGDKVKDEDSAFVGQREKNGWRKAGLPWTYSLDPKLSYHPE